MKTPNFLLILLVFLSSCDTSNKNTKMIFVEGSTFNMGSESGGNDEKPIHEVTINSFYMDKYEVTFEEYDQFCEATNKNKMNHNHWGRGKQPIMYVDWYDAIEFCNWRSRRDDLTPVYIINKTQKDPNNNYKDDEKKWLVTCNWNANGYRLPTEAEWEYAAKGGNKSKGYKWAGTNTENELYRFANFCDVTCEFVWRDSTQNDNYEYTAPVGTYLPNELGLYDMNGNLWEWCWDWRGAYNINDKNNPKGATSGRQRILRGGAWNYNIDNCRLTNRHGMFPNNYFNQIGFRCVRIQ